MRALLAIVFSVLATAALAQGGGPSGGAGGGSGTVTSVVCPNGTITTTGSCKPLAVSGTSGDVITAAGSNGVQDSGVLLTGLAPKASPTFTGTVTFPDGGAITSSGQVSPIAMGVGPLAASPPGMTNPAGANGSALPVVLDVEQEVTGTASGHQGMTLGVGTLFEPAADSDSEYWGGFFETQIEGTHNIGTQDVIGAFGEFDDDTSGTFVGHGEGVECEAYADAGNITSTGIISGCQAEAGSFCTGCTIAFVQAFDANIVRGGSATIIAAADYHARAVDEEGGSDTINTLSGFEADSNSDGGKNIGFYAHQTAGTNNYGFLEDGTALNSFAGIMIFPYWTAKTLYAAGGTAIPTCNSGTKGATATVSDATSPTFDGTYTSGGSVVTPVFCNGSNWITVL